VVARAKIGKAAFFRDRCCSWDVAARAALGSRASDLGRAWWEKIGTDMRSGGISLVGIGKPALTSDLKQLKGFGVQGKSGGATPEGGPAEDGGDSATKNLWRRPKVMGGTGTPAAKRTFGGGSAGKLEKTRSPPRFGRPTGGC